MHAQNAFCALCTLCVISDDPIKGIVQYIRYLGDVQSFEYTSYIVYVTHQMLRSIACRCMEKDWMEDLGSKPKLCVLNSVYVNGLNGRCWKVQKSHRRMLMMLRDGSAPLQIETGRWKGVPRGESLCRECGMNEVEDCDHWLLRCSRWDI